MPVLDVVDSQTSKDFGVQLSAEPNEGIFDYAER